MKTLFIGQTLIRPESTASTNSYLAELNAEKSLPEGAVVITKAQERGRGQRGTTWESEPGKNLTLSILLKPTFLKPEEQFSLSKAAALAVIDFVMSLVPRTASFVPQVKWPNDIYIGDKKTAGILIENAVSGTSIGHSILGIGINVNQGNFSADLPNPTSLKLISGKELDLEECFTQLCSCVEKRYLQLRSDAKAIDSDYLKHLYHFEEWANYSCKGETIKAKIKGVTKAGKLIVETRKNERLEFDFKEIVFL